MPTTLTPTVHERLARCGAGVFVNGLVPGSTVELHVDATVFAATAGGGGHTFTVPPLSAGAQVRARQDAGAGYTPFSPVATVEDAFVPPEAAPGLPEAVGACSQCVRVTHATPGARLELRIHGKLVGSGIAGRDGGACVGVDLREQRGEAGAVLTARQVVCGVDGPETARILTPEPPLPRPVIGDPIFGCQNRVPVSDARPGARLTFETDGGDNLGSICSCWSAVNVFVIRALAVGERVRTRCLYDAQPCDDSGSWSDWRLVASPDERIKPEVLEALVEGDQIIRVANQIPGASLVIRIAATEGDAPEEFGPRPASDAQEIALNTPLVAGNAVSVVQTLCGVSMESDEVIAQPLPPEIYAPVIVPPMYVCGQAVQVSNLHLGALVRVFVDGVPVGGPAWAGLQSSITVPVSLGTTPGRKVTAIQWVGGSVSPESAAVEVQRLGELHPPRLLGPLAVGDKEVWVSGVTPGARVAILSGGMVIGEADAAEPVVRVPVGPLVGSVLVGAAPRVRLCDQTRTGTGLNAIRSPCGTLFAREISETTLDLGDFQVPVVADGGGFTIRLGGQFYAPDPPTAARMPLVVIAHGWHPSDDPDFGPQLGFDQPVPSYKGYDYLAYHLVRWGMLVFSIDLGPVNGLSRSPNSQQFARAEIILRAIAVLQGLAPLQEVLNAGRIGLVGHSMGGEAAVVAQMLNLSENRGFGIRGVVSLAPTRWHPSVVLPGTRYMQIFGSLDQLTTLIPSSSSPGPGGGMRIYDRAERTKTLHWAYGLRHNPFNSLWVPAGDFGEAHLADLALPEAEHRRVAKCLINAFFQEALFGRTAYHGYMEGTVLPQSLRHLEILTSHSRQPRTVLDNFGDDDAQVGLAAEAPLDKSVNSRGLPAAASGTGLGIWEDEQLVSLPNSPHDTAGLRLSWKAPQADYRSEAGGVGGQPDEVIGLRVAQFFADHDLNPEVLPADLFVELSDGAAEATVRLGAVAQIPYADTTLTVLTMMRTVRLPLDAFQAANSALNVGAIQSLTLRLAARPTGNILVDDLEFSR